MIKIERNSNTKAIINHILAFLQQNNVIRIVKDLGYNDPEKGFLVSCPSHKGGFEQHPSTILSPQPFEDIKDGVKRIFPPGFLHCFACGFHADLIQLCLCVDFGEEALDFKADRIDYEIVQLSTKINLPPEVLRDLSSIYGIEPIVLKDALNIQGLKQAEEQGFAAFIGTNILAKKDCFVNLSGFKYLFPPFIEGPLDYVYSRGVSKEAAKLYNIKVNNLDKSVWFPYKDETGSFALIVIRDLNTHTFLYPKGLPRVIYGTYEFLNRQDTDKVMIVESVFNLLTCVTNGIPALALLGSSCDVEILRNILKFKNVKEVILALDNDEAGVRGTKKLAKSLNSFNKSLFFIKEHKKDINDLNEEQFLAYFNSRRHLG